MIIGYNEKIKILIVFLIISIVWYLWETWKTKGKASLNQLAFKLLILVT